MTVGEMKNRLHQQIDASDERLIKMIYALVNEYNDEADTEDGYRRQLVMESHQRYLRGEGKSYSWEEARKMIIEGRRP